MKFYGGSALRTGQFSTLSCAKLRPGALLKLPLLRKRRKRATLATDGEWTITERKRAQNV